jgi:hypothetical protein
MLMCFSRIVALSAVFLAWMAMHARDMAQGQTRPNGGAVCARSKSHLGSGMAYFTWNVNMICNSYVAIYVSHLLPAGLKSALPPHDGRARSNTRSSKTRPIGKRVREMLAMNKLWVGRVLCTVYIAILFLKVAHSALLLNCRTNLSRILTCMPLYFTVLIFNLVLHKLMGDSVPMMRKQPPSTAASVYVTSGCLGLSALKVRLICACMSCIWILKQNVRSNSTL